MVGQADSLKTLPATFLKGGKVPAVPLESARGSPAAKSNPPLSCSFKVNPVLFSAETCRIRVWSCDTSYWTKIVKRHSVSLFRGFTAG